MLFDTVATKPRTRLALSLLPAAVTLVVVAVGLWNMYALRRSAEWVDHTRVIMERSDEMLVEALNGNSGVRGYLITGDTAFLEPFRNARERAHAAQRDVARLTTDNPDQRSRIDSIGRSLDAAFALLDSATGQRMTGRATISSTREMLADGRGYMVRIRELGKQLNDEEQRLLIVRQRALAQRTTLANVFQLVGGGLAVLIALLVNLQLSRMITERDRMTHELGAQLSDIEAMRREMEAVRASNA